MQAFFMWVSKIMAILGGIVLTGLILITCLSIVGRAANTALHSEWLAGPAAQWLLDAGVGAIRGDFELVEAGMAFCIFAFIPYTQITAGHATVDIFTSWMPTRVQKVLIMAAEVLFAIALVIIALQLKEGMDSKIRSGQTSLLLQFPVWWPYAASLVGAAMAAVVSVYVALVRVAEAATGKTLLHAMGAEH